jgi:hypothetical protein
MTGFAGRASGHDQLLLKTPKTKVTEKANKKQTLVFAYCSLRHTVRGACTHLPV